MTQEHPITPPPELVQAFLRSNPHTPPEMTYEQVIATRFARWGADQELEACCEAFEDIWDQEDVVTLNDVLRGIRAARRPKPPSLKDLSLKHLGVMERDGHYLPEIISDLRRAIESLPS